MNSSLLDNKLNEDNYEEYVDKIINIFRLSNKESSIICNINIIDFKAIIELSIISNTGEKQEFTDEYSENCIEKEKCIIKDINKAITQILVLPIPKMQVQELSYEELLKIESKRGIGWCGSSR